MPRKNRRNRATRKRKKQEKREQISKKATLVQLNAMAMKTKPYQRLYEVKSDDGMGGWVLKPKLPIETTTCSTCIIRLCADCDHDCEGSPVCLPCRCAPTMCWKCIRQWVRANGRKCCDEPLCPKKIFTCPSCRKELTIELED
jgi:hypothetical protein